MRAVPVIATAVIMAALAGCGARQADTDAACQSVQAKVHSMATASDRAGQAAVQVGMDLTSQGQDVSAPQVKLQVQQAQLDSARTTLTMWQAVLDDQRCFSEDEIRDAEEGAEHLEDRTASLAQQVSDLQASVTPAP